MSPYCRELLAYVRGELGLSEPAAVRWLNKNTPLWGLFSPDIKEPEIVTSIFLTPYDYATKQPTEYSTELPFDNLEAAAPMMGRAPDIKQGKTWVWFTGQGNGAVCLSPICFNPILPKTTIKKGN